MEFKFRVQMLKDSRWVITAIAENVAPIMLAGVYTSQSAAFNALESVSAAWLAQHCAQEAA